MTEPIHLPIIPQSHQDEIFLQLAKEIMTQTSPEHCEALKAKIKKQFEFLSEDVQKRRQNLYDYIVFDLHCKKESSGQQQFTFGENFQFPSREMIHESEPFYPHSNLSQDTLHSIQNQFHFPNLHKEAKHKFLIYGIHGSGKTTFVHEIFRVITRFVSKSDIMHLHENIKNWQEVKDTDNYKKQRNMKAHWNKTVAYLQSTLHQHPSRWILLDVEHVDLLESIDTTIVLPPHVILVGLTSKPYNCTKLFPKEDSEYIFLDNPSSQLIFTLLECAFLSSIRPYSEIASSSSPFLTTWKEIKQTLQDIAYLLSCRELPSTSSSSNKDKMKQLRTCSSDAKLKYGISLSTLVTLQIPRFLGALYQLRLYWVNTSSASSANSTCVYKKPIHGLCDTQKRLELTKEILEKKKDVTPDEVLAMNNTTVTCDTLKNIDICSDASSVELNWGWVHEAKDKIIQSAKEILLDVYENEKQTNMDYEKMVQFFSAR